MMNSTRVKVEACIHPETYRYSIEPGYTTLVWSRLRQYFGPINENSFNVQWIECRPLMLKSPLIGTPITVVRKKLCTSRDIRQFHELIGYKG